MKSALIDFVNRLRQSGIAVSQAEAMDGASCLQYINIGDRSQFKQALRSSLVKRCHDIQAFDVLFDLHFSVNPIISPDATAVRQQQKHFINPLLTGIEQLNGRQFSPITAMVITGNFAELTRLVLDAVASLPLKKMEFAPIMGRYFVNEVRKRLQLDKVSQEMPLALAEIGRRTIDRNLVRAFREQVTQTLLTLEKAIERLVLTEVQALRFTAFRRIEAEEMAERNLYHLTDEDIRTMRPEVERLTKRLKDRIGMRFKRANRRKLDVRRTMRSNIGCGGFLPDLRFKSRMTTKPQVVALCDVSRSVRDFSRFMLLFLYTLKEVIPRIRSFIFVGDLTEVTSLFQDYVLNEAVARAAAGQGLKYPFGTDYGSSLGQFVNQYLGVINSRTTVMILGDARNNNLPPRISAMQSIAERAKKIIWMNPEPVTFWGTGDSVMHLYEPYCATLTECGCLAQLSAALEQNLLP